MLIPKRIYVEVRVRFDRYGGITPLQIMWSDGRVFEVDRILEQCRAASSAGSCGMRYTVKILGKTRYLFFEDVYSDTGNPRWFIESTKQD